MFSTKAGAARLLIAVVVGLITLKLIVSWATGSMSVLAQAADSFLDLFAGVITFSPFALCQGLPMPDTPTGTARPRT